MLCRAQLQRTVAPQRVSKTVAWLLLHVADEETEAQREMACAKADSFLGT